MYQTISNVWHIEHVEHVNPCTLHYKPRHYVFHNNIKANIDWSLHVQCTCNRCTRLDVFINFDLMPLKRIFKIHNIYLTSRFVLLLDSRPVVRAAMVLTKTQSITVIGQRPHSSHSC